MKQWNLNSWWFFVVFRQQFDAPNLLPNLMQDEPLEAFSYRQLANDVLNDDGQSDTFAKTGERVHALEPGWDAGRVVLHLVTIGVRDGHDDAVGANVVEKAVMNLSESTMGKMKLSYRWIWVRIWNGKLQFKHLYLRQGQPFANLRNCRLWWGCLGSVYLFGGRGSWRSPWSNAFQIGAKWYEIHNIVNILSWTRAYLSRYLIFSGTRLWRGSNEESVCTYSGASCCTTNSCCQGKEWQCFELNSRQLEKSDKATAPGYSNLVLCNSRWPRDSKYVKYGGSRVRSSPIPVAK